MNERLCPVCGAVMAQAHGRGATARKHGVRWVCLVAVDEVVKDEHGRLSRRPGSKHTTTRVWTDDELEIEAQP